MAMGKAAALELLWATESVGAFRENSPTLCCSTLVPTCNFVFLPKNKILHIHIYNMSSCSKDTRQTEQ